MSKDRCTKCYCPNDIYPGHNTGCPDHPDSNEEHQRQFDKGYQFGYDDNYIEPCFYKNYNKSYILGYRAGKDKCDDMIDEAAQARCFG